MVNFFFSGLTAQPTYLPSVLGQHSGTPLVNFPCYAIQRRVMTDVSTKSCLTLPSFHQRIENLAKTLKFAARHDSNMQGPVPAFCNIPRLKVMVMKSYGVKSIRVFPNSSAIYIHERSESKAKCCLRQLTVPPRSSLICPANNNGMLRPCRSRS